LFCFFLSFAILIYECDQSNSRYALGLYLSLITRDAIDVMLLHDK